VKSFCQWAGKEVGTKEAKERVRDTGKSGEEMQTCLKVRSDMNEGDIFERKGTHLS